MASIAYHQAVAHELAHLMGQVSAWNDDRYDHTHGGTGWHCSTGAQASSTDPNFVYDGGSCIMFHYPNECEDFCPKCEVALRRQRLKELKLPP